MMSRADGNPILIQDLRHIMRMHAFECERSHPALVLGIGTKKLYPRNLLQTLERVFRNFMLMRCNRFHAERGEIIHCRAETNRLCNGRRPCFEFMRERVWTERTQFHFLNHVAATKERWHFFE